MTAILGISAYYHDSAAALVVDGKIVAAAQEERFSRRKHDARFPRQSIDFCLQQAGIRISDLGYVGFYEKPLKKFDRLIETFLDSTPWGYASFRRAVPVWVTEKLRLRRELHKGLDDEFSRRLIFCDHHQSHAASAFFPSPFTEAAILTVDGVGEWATACYGIGRQNQLELSHEMRFPHSIGLLYSSFTEYLGFRVNGGEYKIMGLAPYGNPIYQEVILNQLVTLNDDGSFRMNLDYFHFCRGLSMTNRRFHQLFGAAPRVPESELTQRHMDIAASIQKVTESILLRMAQHVYEATQLRHLVLAGGVALNSVANRVIERDGPFDRIWVQPAAGDAGGALGAALLVQHELLGEPRGVTLSHEPSDSPMDQPTRLNGSRLGPEFSQMEIESALIEAQVPHRTYEDENRLCEEVAQQLAEQKTVGWFQGRMEFGPRALGARSILADPRDAVMAATLNRRVKRRESFRPFAPVVLQEHVSDYFDVSGQEWFPFMHTVADVTASLPAVTHVDGTARLQTADELRHRLLRKLLQAFQKVTDCPVLVNTSFNIRGEPIVCRPVDALRCFLATELDVLVVGRSILFKNEQTEEARASAHEELGRQIADSHKCGAAELQLDSLLRPSPLQLKRFGVSWLIGMPFIGWLAGASTTMIGGLGAVGLMGGVLGMVRPQLLRGIYRVVTIPIALGFAELGLLVLYIGLVLPMGLLSRVFGRDPLQRRTGATCWTTRNERTNAESYFRQS